MSCYAKVIKDSLSPDGIRLTTMEIRTWRFVLAEFNTHRAFSRNSASSRAIPFPTQLKRMDEIGLAYPIEWPREQKGMQGGELFTGDAVQKIDDAWATAAKAAVDIARALHGAGVHKSVINRLLEPYMWHTMIVTSTAWENFFDQRCSPLAQPEIRVTADAMLAAMRGSTPNHLEYGDWHLPYVEGEDLLKINAESTIHNKMQAAKMISAARTARVSYLTMDGKRDIFLDIDLFTGTEEKRGLSNASPPHWSPMEHVATPWADNLQPKRSLFWDDGETTSATVSTEHLPRVGNLAGWRSMRTEEESKRSLVTFR